MPWDTGENVNKYQREIEYNIRNNVCNAAVVENSTDATRCGENLDPVEENASFEEYHDKTVND
jgi:hypothetical protein